MNYGDPLNGKLRGPLKIMVMKTMYQHGRCLLYKGFVFSNPKVN